MTMSIIPEIIDKNGTVVTSAFVKPTEPGLNIVRLLEPDQITIDTVPTFKVEEKLPDLENVTIPDNLVSDKPLII